MVLQTSTVRQTVRHAVRACHRGRVLAWVAACLAVSATVGARLAFADEAPSVPKHRIQEMHGWTLHINESLFAEEANALEQALPLLAGQLERTVAAVPPRALEQLRQVPIWINPPPTGKRPSAEYHPNADWLRKNRRDPTMAKAVELTNVANFPFENRRMPSLMLHELAHAYHDRVLGFDHPDIVAAYDRAQAAGDYDRVQRFNGRKIVSDKAYAMTNHKEYFAESTEAFFGRNDFFPFDRIELQTHDPNMYELLSEVWGTSPTPAPPEPAR